MQARYIREMVLARGHQPSKITPDKIEVRGGLVYQLVGYINDLPDCWRHVELGNAIPHDEECRVKCNMTIEEFAEAKRLADRREAKIHPDDFDAWDKGWMIGYDKNGQWIPGPNFNEFKLTEELDEEEDE